jgi:hypothetical protein
MHPGILANMINSVVKIAILGALKISTLGCPKTFPNYSLGCPKLSILVLI